MAAPPQRAGEGSALSESSREPAPRGDASGDGVRRRTRSDPVGWATARTLYNLVDARWPERAGADVLPGIERAVRHAGPGAARRLWLACRLLDLEPLLHGPVRRRFWRLPRAERARAAARWERSARGFRHASWQLLAEAVEAAPVAERAPHAPPQSASGA